MWDIFLPSNSSSPYSKNDSRTRVFREKYAFSSHYQHSAPIAALFLLAYILIFLMCMTGNMLPGVTVLTNRQMWTVTNMFILNLAIHDLLVGTFCMPTTLVDNLITGKQGNEHWPLDNIMCKMSGLVQGMSVSSSAFTLVAIAVE
ncbi:unnamed protein product, partial [Lepidochelys kempii]